MKPSLLLAIFSVATTLVSTGSTAQNVYRCGQNYSQTPCEGGVRVDAADARSPAQAQQTRQAAQQDAQTAGAMEKQRLKQEKADLAANARPASGKASAAKAAKAPARLASAPASAASKPHKKGKSEPEFFTAKVPEPTRQAKAGTPATPASGAKKKP